MMYFHDMNTVNPRMLSRRNFQQPSKTLKERAQAFLDAERGTQESRDLILGLLLAYAQLQDTARLAEEIMKADESKANGDN